MADQILSPKSLAHVVLRTANYKSMVAFYKTFLGARATWESDFLAFLTYDDEHHRVAIVYIPGTTEKVRTSAGLDHVAFTFDNLTDLLVAYKQRKARGILPYWCVNHGPTTSIYYQDPDGNRLETQVDNFDTVEEANVFMSSPSFAANPIGVDFEPEELIERLENNKDETAIKGRAEIGPRGIETVPEPPKPEAEESYSAVVDV